MSSSSSSSGVRVGGQDTDSSPSQAASSITTLPSEMQEIVNLKIARLEADLSESEKSSLREKDMERVWQAYQLRITAISQAEDSEERKLAALTRLLHETVVESETRRFDLQAAERKYLVCCKDKEAIQLQLQKVTNLKDRLESLCRELQKKNKVLADDLRYATAEQQQKHQSLKEKFEAALTDIQCKLQLHSQDNGKLAQENQELQAKIKQFLLHEEVKQQHFAHQLKTKELEQQLAEAKYKQQLEIANQESRKSKVLTEKVTELLGSEAALRQQLDDYASKFSDIQASVANSNSVFTSFKNEMTKLSAQVTQKEKEKLTSEKEKLALEMKLGQTQLSLIQLCNEQKKDRAELDKLKRQRDQLQSLCKLFEKDKARYRDDATLLLQKVKEFDPDFKLPETGSSVPANDSAISTSETTPPHNSASSLLLTSDSTPATANPDLTISSFSSSSFPAALSSCE